jgi:hypothetical protein
MRRPLHTVLIVSIFFASCGEQGQSVSAKKQQPAPNGADVKTDTKPRLSFLSPLQDLDTDQDIDVTVKFTGDTKKISWNLFFTLAEDADAEPIAIAEKLTAQVTKVPWNIGLVEPGSYTLKATFTSPSGSGRVINKANILIRDRQKPVVKITSPEEKKVFLTTSPQQISFKAEDPDGTSLTFKIEVSPDAGKTWSTITDGLTKTTFSWNTSKLTQGTQYKLRISATNSRGTVGSATMDQTFAIATGPVTYATSLGKLLGDKCAACHAVGTVNAAQFRCDSYDLATTGVSAKTDSIRKRTEAGTMPPSAPLSAKEKEIITLWIWSGAQ